MNVFLHGDSGALYATAIATVTMIPGTVTSSIPYKSADDRAAFFEESREGIDAADVAVFVCTDPKLFDGIAAGYAYANGVPVLAIAYASSRVLIELPGISWVYLPIEEGASAAYSEKIAEKFEEVATGVRSLDQIDGGFSC